MKRKKHQRQRAFGWSAVAVVYAGTLALFLLAALHPHHNSWSASWWAHYPVPVPLGLFFAGLVFLYVAFRLMSASENTDLSRQTACVGTLVTVICFGLLFWLLRAQTHYLGDGYQLLSRLASANPLIKPWNFGGIAAPYWLSSIVGDGSEPSVLLSYQIISILSGIALMVVVFLAARKLFADNTDRLLFLLGVMTGGTSLLFFGYVENYSLFVLSVFGFALIGLLAAQGKASRFWVLPLLVLAVFFHIFGVFLIPAAVYVLVSNSRFGDWTASRSEALKWGASVTIALLLAVVFWRMYTAHYFIRFAFLPIVADQFTVEGYTLFSLRHLLDWLNLLILLLPGILVVIAVFTRSSQWSVFSRREFRFLLITLVCCLGAVFVLDPKLGMPRDWDLFSFAGVPLIVLVYFALLNPQPRGRGNRTAAILMIGLGLLVLLPRAWSQTDNETSWAHLRNYFIHDPAKNVPLRSVWILQLEASGQRPLAEREAQKGREDSPETGLEDYAWELARNRRYDEAIVGLRRVVELNPMRAKSWAGIGFCYAQTEQPDSALKYLQIADGLSPYSPFVYNQLAYTYFGFNEVDLAETYWEKTLEIEAGNLSALVGLSTMYASRGEMDKYDRTFSVLAGMADVPVSYFADEARKRLEQGDTERARRAFQLARRRAPESPEVTDLLRQHPELGTVPE